MDDVDVLRDLLDVPAEPGMNADLAAWADENEQRPDHTPANDAERRASRAGPCRVCRRPSQATCLECNKPACLDHIHVMYGLCALCAKADTHAKTDHRHDPGWGTSKGHPEVELGIDWVDD